MMITEFFSFHADVNEIVQVSFVLLNKKICVKRMPKETKSKFQFQLKITMKKMKKTKNETKYCPLLIAICSSFFYIYAFIQCFSFSLAPF